MKVESVRETGPAVIQFNFGLRPSPRFRTVTLSFSHQRWRDITVPNKGIGRIIPAAMVPVLSLSPKLLLASALEGHHLNFKLNMVSLLRLAPESP
jgi:hypothetical protein